MKKITALLLSLLLGLGLAGCSAPAESLPAESVPAASQPVESLPAESTPAESEPAEEYWIPDEYGYYYELDNVVLYLEYYGELPDNYITKKEARDLGWEGGSVERYMEGAAIGGDRFGNREGLLPKGNYTECDLYTQGANSRGAERLVFSDTGRYYYTGDHYETFDDVIVTEDWQVIWK